MAEKPVNVTPEDQKLQHANAQQNDLAKLLAYLEESVHSQANLNGFDRDRKTIGSKDTVTLYPPPFARSVLLSGQSSWTIKIFGSMSMTVSGPLAMVPVLSPGSPIEVSNTGSSDIQVTVLYLGQNPSLIMAPLISQFGE